MNVQRQIGRIVLLILLAAMTGVGAKVNAQAAPEAKAQAKLGQKALAALAGLDRREWKVDEVDREGLIYAPANAKEVAAPVVFAFHGHGGSMRNAAVMFHYHQV